MIRCCRDPRVSDFDVMWERRRELKGKTRKRKVDEEIINDNDDFIDGFVKRILAVAEVCSSVYCLCSMRKYSFIIAFFLPVV